MPRPLIINVQSQRRPYHSGPNVESLEHYTNDDIEIYHRGAHVNRSEHNIPDHRRRGKKSKYAHPEKETQEPPRRYREHNRAEKSTITRSKSLADLKRNRRPHGHEDESSRMYQRRHSNTEAHPKMFDFRETFSKFENLTTESQNGNIEREFQTVSSPRTRGRSTVDQEASDLREIDQIKSRARLLVQEARQFGRRDKQNYLEWQDEVIQLLKKIGEVDNRNSEAVQKEKQKTLRIFKQSYPSPDVARVEKVKTTTVQNGLSESKVNVYSEVDPPIVKVSQLRNMYESKHWDEDPKPVPTYRETKYYSELHNSSKQSHELVKQQNFDDSEYTSSSRYSYSSSSGSDEDKPLYETHEGEIHEVEPPRERNVEESHIAKVRDLRSVFERDNYQPDEELLPTNTSSKLPVQIARMPVESAQKIEEREKPSDEEIPSTKLPTHIVTRPSKWFKKTEEDEEEEVPQEESSGVYRVDDDGFIVEPNDGTPRRVRDTLKDEQIVHSVTVKELKNVFEGNGPSQNPEVQTATMQIAHEQKYIPYEEYDNNMQQTVVITDLNNEENDEENPVDTSHIAKVKELKDAIEKNEDNSQNTTKINQVRYQVVYRVKHQPLVENEESERVVISELTTTNGEVAEEDANEDNAQNTTEENQVRYQVVYGIKHQPLVENEESESVVISELTTTNDEIAVEDAHEDSSSNKDEILEYGTKLEVALKPDDSKEESPEIVEDIKHNVVVKETELTDQEKLLISKKVLDEINEDIHSYGKEINNLDGEDEKKRMFLNEMLLRSVIQLENLETQENEELIRERKEALLFLESSL
ncbi:uncharacterized protein LOC112905040 [Agrilus planipennis]|uniref:Uncharacterized protein LOC112905040 n=1 Tax=Agrilus planipennis TaxID=224129 RepID=A0A7F5R8U9_AGRPL|nr:uncharacterized protein LOC112905040 [Agrilus planipennis]